MGTSSNITNLLLLTALSSSAISLGYENNQNIAPSEMAQYNFKETKTWSYSSMPENNEYSVSNFSQEQIKIDTIVRFSNELVGNNESLDSEFSQIVNDNFWDIL